ncbi:MAG: 30S ribosomal protein S1 [Sulfobacillus thermosulfidooxidans]|nr:30S ribosomal protein S1 [Sulfobacillus sp. hq2]PSR37087.1 MAG: 30S ribosomal protein S1 [Sulfobacillus thermosulfidooxidans]
MPEETTNRPNTPEHEELMNMEETLAYAPMEDVHPGDIVAGKVVHISNDGVLVDVGAKSEGIIHLQDLSHRHVDRPEDVVKLGETISVYVLGYEGEEGSLKLSKRRADEQEAWARLEEAQKTGEILHAPVVEIVKGGLVVDVGLRGFIPASHIARGYVNDMTPYLHQVVPVKVVELDRGKRRAILSRKIAMELETNAKREQLWAGIEEGQIRHGVVKSLTDFGAFIDLGGVDGLLHISEMSWGRINHPSEVLMVGQEVDVKVLRLDPEKNKISLGLRQVLPNPWEGVEDRYTVGGLYEGTVVRLAGFGAFVELEPGVDGLVHISQLASERVHQPSDVVAVGDRIWVKVLSVDAANKRISLSKREADQDIADGALATHEHHDEVDANAPLGEHLAAYHAGDWDDEEPS